MIELVGDQTLDGATSGAWLSEDQRYRYRLWRIWDPHVPSMAFVMLNPSTADHTRDDPTIRRCIGFAHREGAGGIEVVNLWALRSTDWRALREADDPVGVDNENVVQAVLRSDTVEYVVAAWGSHVVGVGEPPFDVAALARTHGRVLWCLGTTDKGSPRHPLFIRNDQPLVPWP